MEKTFSFMSETAHRDKNLAKIHQKDIKHDQSNFACKHPIRRQSNLSKNNTNFSMS